MAETPSIAGTYGFVRRELPNGTVQHPPQVKGILTFTNEYRNFSVVWKDQKGKFYSECYVARYTLTDREYSEIPEYLIVDDQIGGKGINHDLSGQIATSPVERDGDCIRFALPQPFERALSIEVEFNGPKLTATGKGHFVDHWEKVS